MRHKKIFIILWLSIFFSSYGFCATYYIAPSLEVPIRKGADFSRKIVAILKDGTQVEFIKEEGAWAFIRTESGKEGWILKRYLTKELPPKLQVEKLRAKNKKLFSEYKNLKEQLATCSQEGSGCKNELAKCLSQKEEISNKFETLKQDAANIIETKKLLIETQKALEEANAERIKLKQQLNSVKANTNIKWFLAGGGVLLIGWILGLITNKRRRRRPSLL